MIEIKIGENEENQRLDKFLRKYLPNAPLSYIYRIVRKKNVKLNGRKADIDTILEAGDILFLYLSEEETEGFKDKKKVIKVRKQFKVAYEDENILVVEKPKGLLVHGTIDERKNTLVNQVCSYLQQKGDYDPNREKTFVPAAVNRLDRNTSGLVIFGKNYKSLQALNEMFREKTYIHKYYMTIVYGHVTKPMHIKGKLFKDEEKNKVYLVRDKDKTTKEVETIFKPLMSNGMYTLLEVELITGRTHQIRAHLADAGYPLLGDEKYGNRKINEKIKKEFGLTTQYLHAYKLFFEKSIGIIDYMEGKEIYSELPQYLIEIKQKMFTESRRK